MIKSQTAKKLLINYIVYLRFYEQKKRKSTEFSVLFL